MEKKKVVRGDKIYGPKIKQYFERFCGCETNPNNLICDCETYFYFVNKDGELDFEYDFELDFNEEYIVSLDTVLFTLGENLRESFKNVVSMENIKCKAQSYVDYFDDILKEMSEVHQRKNADYGNNFHKIYEKYGFMTALLRLTDKMERLENIYEKGEIQVKDETVEDTLLDLANYAVMAIVELRNKNKGL